MPVCEPQLLDKDVKQVGYSWAVDWWAFGCVLFEMLTGRTAFGKPDVGASAPPPQRAPALLLLFLVVVVVVVVVLVLLSVLLQLPSQALVGRIPPPPPLRTARTPAFFHFPPSPLQ